MSDEHSKKIGLVNTIYSEDKTQDLVDDLIYAITQQQLGQMSYARAIEVTTTVRDGKERDPESGDWHDVKYVQTTGWVTDVAAQVMGLGR